jgi:hypothetical protein
MLILMKINRIVLVWFLIALIFFIRSYIFLDPDFGWHIRMGKIISETGTVPAVDLFTYTMPGYTYIDHEWLTDLLIFKTYKYLGYFGLSLVFTFLMTTTIWFGLNNKIFNNVKIKHVPLPNKMLLSILFIIAAAFSDQFGVRPQVISWFLLSLLLFLLPFLNKFKILNFLLLPYFVLWANLHGEFVLGLAVIMFVLLRGSRGTVKALINILVIFMSTVATLVNPFGFKLWEEVFGTVSSKPLHLNIAEWEPFFRTLNVGFIIIAVISLVFIFKYASKLSKPYTVLVLTLFAMSLVAAINIPLFVVCSTPLVIRSLSMLYEDSKRIKYGVKHLVVVTNWFFGFSVILYILSSVISVKNAYKLSEISYYPGKAIQFLSLNPQSGEMFSVYNWGGYLIWKFPQKKVFIDGRMAHWPGILDLENQIVEGKIDYIKVFKDKNISTVLWPKKQQVDEFSTRLLHDGWHIIYSDTQSLVLTKNSSI